MGWFNNFFKNDNSWLPLLWAGPPVIFSTFHALNSPKGEKTHNFFVSLIDSFIQSSLFLGTMLGVDTLLRKTGQGGKTANVAGYLAGLVAVGGYWSFLQRKVNGVLDRAIPGGHAEPRLIIGPDGELSFGQTATPQGDSQKTRLNIQESADVNRFVVMETPSLTSKDRKNGVSSYNRASAKLGQNPLSLGIYRGL